MPEPQPTVETIREVREYLLPLWRPSHADWEDVDSFLNGEYEVWVLPDGKPDTRAKNRRQFRPPTAHAKATNSTNQMLGYRPKFHRDQVGRGDVAVTDTSAIENWMDAVWHQATIEESSLAIKTAAWYGITLGYSILQLDLNVAGQPKKPGRQTANYAEALDQYNDQMVGFNPFRVLAPHPSTVLLPWDSKMPEMALVTGKWSSDSLRVMTEERARRKGKNRPLEVNIWDSSLGPYWEVGCEELWTLEWHAMRVVNGEMLFVERNWWEFVPFTHGFSGFGHLVTKGSEPAPYYLAQGIFPKVVREAIRHQAQGMSARLDALAAATYPIEYTGRDPAWLAEQQAKSDIVGGEGLRKDEVWYQDAPNLPQYLERASEWIDQSIERATISDLFGGFRPEGVATVGQHAMLTDQGQKNFTELAQQIDYMASVIAKNILRLFIKMDDSMVIGGFKLSPEQLRNNPQVGVTFEQMNLGMQLQLRELMAREEAQGLISKRTVRESGIRLEDEAGERERLLDQRLEESPLVAAHEDKVTALEMGKEEVAAQIEEEIRQMEADNAPQT